MSRKPRLRKFDFDAEKFKELIVYVAERCADDPSFGAVKLNKILYYADFDAYRLLGEPITGARYLKYGAGPGPCRLVDVRDELVEGGRLRIEKRNYFNRQQKRLVPVEGMRANREVFSPEEREIVDSVIDFFWSMSERAASDYSHREPGWLLVGEREEIPYQTAFLSGDPMDQETEEAGIRIGKEFLASRR